MAAHSLLLGLVVDPKAAKQPMGPSETGLGTASWTASDNERDHQKERKTYSKGLVEREVTLELREQERKRWIVRQSVSHSLPPLPQS